MPPKKPKDGKKETPKKEDDLSEKMSNLSIRSASESPDEKPKIGGEVMKPEMHASTVGTAVLAKKVTTVYEEVYAAVGNQMVNENGPQTKTCNDIETPKKPSATVKEPKSEEKEKKKHTGFIKESMCNKDVTKISGIGEEAKKKLVDAGIDKAHNLFEQYILLKKDETQFIKWLKETAGVREDHAKQAFDCLNEWAKNFLL